MEDIDARTRVSMVHWIVLGLLKALCEMYPTLPRRISEILSVAERNELHPIEDEGLDMAMKWVWKIFTEHSPPQ